MVVDRVEGHPAVLAVLVLDDHRHWDGCMYVARVYRCKDEVKIEKRKNE